jgi:hypothetical protein
MQNGPFLVDVKGSPQEAIVNDPCGPPTVQNSKFPTAVLALPEQSLGSRTNPV